MNYGDSRSSRSAVRILAIFIIIVIAAVRLHGCVTGEDRTSSAKAAKESARVLTPAEKRAKAVGGWMRDVGYRNVHYHTAGDTSVASGEFEREGLVFTVQINDDTPIPGDNELITISIRNAAGDVGCERHQYDALAAPTPQTAYDNYTTQTVANHQ